MKPEERIIIQELKKGNQVVFEHLFKTYYSGLVRFSEGILFDPFMAEDEVQQLFIYVWENVRKLEINTSLKAYLYQATRNRCLNRLKSIHVYDKNKILYREGILNSGELEYVEDEKTHQAIQAALKQLPDQQQQIARLKYLEGKKYAEVADVLNISVNTVKTQLSRAKAGLRKIMGRTLTCLLLILGL
ncbi:MAG: RNA polymerase sigma-70 factor [Reichenbachiella sp.]|uniref:RNA polymerase sigma-70 factor n=1 Tax=Reichenbachiella sp. TaxID=2184521 RepID=UPI00326711E6